jgi:NADH-quinone oxidoreductase subunit C
MTAARHIDVLLDDQALAALQAYLAGKGYAATLALRELTLTIPAEGVLETLTFLRDDPQTQFKMLIDLTAVDWLGTRPQNQRFDVVYHLLSTTLNQRLRVTVPAGEGQQVPTATGVYAAANWYEREVWDMFGIPFSDHPDLRRILTDYDFAGHPLRKDFPLEGFVEVYYDAAQQRVAYKPVDLPQEFRHFDQQSPWRGMTGNAPLADEDRPFQAEEFK